MNDGTGVLWLVLVICIAFSAIFSSSETAFSSVNLIRMKSYASQNNKRAKRVLRLSGDYNSILTAILIGNNIVNIAASSIGTVLFTSYFGASGPAVSTVVLTVLILIFGEVMPKSIAKDKAESVSMASSGFLSVLTILFKPFILLFNGLKKLTERFTKSDSQPSVTEQELKVIVEEIESEGVLEDHESQLVRSALDFDETTAEEVLVPRVDIISVEVSASVEEIKQLFLTERFSRVPVYERSIDNIVGVLYEKDFFRAYIQNGEHIDIRGLLQQPLFIPPQTKISDLLKQIQSVRAHMAVVTDQYGGVEGIVTLEDVLEELVGEIYDEDEEIVEDVQRLGPGCYRVNPDMAVEDLFEEIEFEPKHFSSDSNTVGGWVFELLEHIPEPGEQVSFEELTLTVTDLSDQRIRSLEVHLGESGGPERQD